MILSFTTLLHSLPKIKDKFGRNFAYAIKKVMPICKRKINIEEKFNTYPGSKEYDRKVFRSGDIIEWGKEN